MTEEILRDEVMRALPDSRGIEVLRLLDEARAQLAEANEALALNVTARFHEGLALDQARAIARRLADAFRWSKSATEAARALGPSEIRAALAAFDGLPWAKDDPA